MDRDICEKLESLLKSSQSLILCETLEEERLRGLIRFAVSNLGLQFFEWSIVDGFKQNAKIQIDNTQDPVDCLKFIKSQTEPAVYFLKDFSIHLQNSSIVRLMREVVIGITNPNSSIILCSPEISLSSELSHLGIPFELSLPSKSELKALLSSVIEALKASQKIKVEISESEMESLISSLSGLTLRQARQILTYAISTDRGLRAKEIDVVIQRKAELIQASGLLELYPSLEEGLEIGGFANLKDWLETAAVAFSEDARKLNIPAPKGILLVGIPGCGKSLCAKIIASRWRQPLIRLDASRLFDKFVGETERNFRKATHMVDAMSPCVFWIDEIEKIMGGNGEASNDGAGQRAFGLFLTWMQEKRPGVFLVATANDISRLPPELLRKGRFDEIFFVDLPNLVERAEIIKIQTQKHKLKPDILNSEELAQLTDGFSGAEIEQFLTTSLLKCLREKKPISIERLREDLVRFIPLSQSRAEEIQNMRKFAKSKFLSVS